MCAVPCLGLHCSRQSTSLASFPSAVDCISPKPIIRKPVVAVRLQMDASLSDLVIKVVKIVVDFQSWFLPRAWFFFFFGLAGNAEFSFGQ